jgi:ribosome silencing factor RsfS/YbeB/iojap
MLASTTRVHAPPASGLAPRSRGTASAARRSARFGVGDARRVVHLPRAVSEPPAAGPGEVERAPARASEPGPDEEAAEAAARELAVIADETRAADVRVLGVSRKVHWARYFILATAFNRPQMQAVATKMRDHLNEKHGLSLAKNVTQQGDWVCVDCGEVVVHVFTPQSREFYDIEALYRDAVDVELPFETERPMEDEFEVF